MNTIFKYPLPLSGTTMAMPKHQTINLNMPEGAKILTAQVQGNELVMWAEVDPKKGSKGKVN